MYIPCEASSWTLLHHNRKLSSRISLQNQLFCLCRLPAVYLYLELNQNVTKIPFFWLVTLWYPGGDIDKIYIRCIVEITGACSRKTKIPKKKDILRGKTMKRKNDFFSKKGRRYRALQLQASLRSYHTLQVKFDLHGLCFLVI